MRMYSRRRNPLFKTMAMAIVISFLWHEILWAADLQVTALDNLVDQQSQNFAPEYLINQEENLKGQILTFDKIMLNFSRWVKP